MKKSTLLAILVIVFAVGAGVLGWLYANKHTAEKASVEDITAKWAASAHGDVKAEVFHHWDDSDDKTITPGCAKCHSENGLKDYLGLDGSAALSVEGPVYPGGTIGCGACHNTYFAANTSVVFPSGVSLEADKGSQSCWTCHQGTTAGINGQLAQKTEGVGDDEAKEGLSFVNPHYLGVASIYMGSEANGGYQYPGKTYAGKYDHEKGVQTCTECHDTHSLHMAEPGYTKCAQCHENVTKWPDQRTIRKTTADYDGDGNVKESMYDEIDHLQKKLVSDMQIYAKDIAGGPLGATDKYPYWFDDANENGTQDEGEKNYAHWTPKLMRAAFNYKFVLSSKGYIHNPPYAAQLLIDSISDLAASDTAVSAEGLVRPE